MTADDYSKAIAALLAWREERSNGVPGMTAVLFVVRNRLHEGSFGHSWTEVIGKHNQFSSMTHAGDTQTVTYPDVRDPLFLSVLQIVDTVYDETRPDNLTDGALYYADLSSPYYNKNGWFEKTIVLSKEHPRVAQVGTTTYFE